MVFKQKPYYFFTCSTSPSSENSLLIIGPNSENSSHANSTGALIQEEANFLSTFAAVFEKVRTSSNN